jgi:hypothetical protein
MLGRGWHAAIAVLVCGAMALQIVIAIRVSGTPHDVTAGVLRGSSLPGRIIRVLSFFTVQSNLLSGIVSAQLAIRPDRDGRARLRSAPAGRPADGSVVPAVSRAVACLHPGARGDLEVVSLPVPRRYLARIRPRA